MRRLALAPTLVCAFLSPQAALAVGLGEIELQSALNQPLDAEIPLRGVSGEDAGDIMVALASEDAFRRVGLERSFSLTRLEFEVITRNGSPVIQVSSREPIAEPFLSFLIEVDAPEGNLLREYTVLLDPPVFATGEVDEQAAPEPPPAAEQPEREPAAEAAQAPATPDSQAAMRGRIADSADRGVPGDPGAAMTPGGNDSEPNAATEVPKPVKSAEAAEDVEGAAPNRALVTDTEEQEFGDTPLFLRVAREEEASERRMAERMSAQPEPAESAAGEDAEAVAAAEPAVRDRYGEVREGETLWEIAAQLRQGEVTVQQMMLALLRYNPEAFEDGNINRLKRGYVLEVPDAETVRSLSAQRAIAQVREQNGLWREWREGLEQGGEPRLASAGEAQADGDASTDSDAAQGSGESGGDGGDSRLDIVGADDGGATSDESASATSSADAGASEALQLAREELASVRAEKEELAGRVEHLEGTVEKMEQLVTVREEQLARLQQQLAELREEVNSTTGSTDARQNAGEQAPAAEDDVAATAVSGAQASGGGDGGAAPETGEPAAGAEQGATGSHAGDGASQSAGGDADARGAQTTASDEPDVVQPTTPPQKSWLDSVFGFVRSVGALLIGVFGGLAAGPLSPMVLAAAGLAILGLSLLVVRRRRAARAIAEEEFSAPVGADAALRDDDPVAAGGASLADPIQTGGAGVDDDPTAALMDEDLDLSALGLDDEPGGAAPVEKDDTLAEADTYIAYGLHQQAEDLLRLALEESPERQDYHEKLLEALYAAGKGDAFASAADRFRDGLNDPDALAWQRVREMGRKIAPQHALFSGDASAVGAAPPSAGGAEMAEDLVELGSADAGGDSFEEVLRSEAERADAGNPASEPAPALASTDADDDLAFDLGQIDQAPASTPASMGSDSHDVDAGLDFEIGDLSGLDADRTSAETSEPAVDAGNGLDFDAGDLGGFSEPEPGAAVGAAAEPEPGASASAAAAGNDAAELGLDLDDALGGTLDTSSVTNSRPSADLGEPDTTLDLDDTLGLSSASEVGDAGALDLDQFEAAADTSAGGGSVDTATADPAVDFDFSSLEQDLERSAPPTNGAGDPVGDDEDLATMLDLAKAYIDMGDAESASNALEEVIAAGSDAQRAEARSLLETVQ